MGWWLTEGGLVIGDEPADIVGEVLDSVLEQCRARFPFTVEQFLATVAFASGHISLGTEYSLELMRNGTIQGTGLGSGGKPGT